MLFVTACDDNYFVYALAQIWAVERLFKQYPIVYDLGLCSDYKGYLKGLGIELRHHPSEPDKGKDYPSDYQPMALFKPTLLLDACTRYMGAIVYLDADAKPMQHFEFPAKDLGLARVDNWDRSLYTGPVHSGVIFLSNTNKRMSFLLDWAKDLWNDCLPSDKKSLNRIVPHADMELTELPAREYNARMVHPETKIFHQRVI